MIAAHRVIAWSSIATCAGVAPFCGPKVAAAPRGPSIGLSTSVATTRGTPSSRLRAGARSAAAAAAVADDPHVFFGCSSFPNHILPRYPAASGRN
jgi:hypothetical protein